MAIQAKDLPEWAQKQILKQLREREQRRAAETEKQAEAAGKRKYRNVPTSVKSGEAELRFDSRKEAERFEALKLLLDAGAIRDLRLQQEFTLIEAYTTPEGKRMRAERYRADFTYYTADGKYVVEDAKGGSATKTKTYEIKKKQMRDKFGIEITEV